MIDWFYNLGVLSSVISSAAALMVLSKIAKGEIIQSGYLKKHMGEHLYSIKFVFQKWTKLPAVIGIAFDVF